jgi:hypothetical protein
MSKFWVTVKGGLKSEDTGEFLLLQSEYSKSLSWAENLNKLFTVLGGKFKFFVQDSDLEYWFWRCKNPPASSDLKPTLMDKDTLILIGMSYVWKQEKCLSLAPPRGIFYKT